jgi:hypothetical protein
MKESKSFDCGDLLRLSETERAAEGILSEKDMCYLRGFKCMNLLVPCMKKTSGMSVHFSMLGLHSKNGENYIPAFSCPEELEKWPYGKDGAAVFSYEDIKNRVIDNPKKFSGIIINPFSDMLLLQLDVIRQTDAMLDGIAISKVEHIRNMRLSRLERTLPDISEAVSAFCKTREEIYCAYLLMAQVPEDSKAHWLLLIDFDGERVSLFPEMTRVVSPYIRPEENFEIMKADYRLLQGAAAISWPIYEKFDLAR